MSAMITAYNGMTRKVNPANLFGDWILSTLRRLAKGIRVHFPVLGTVPLPALLVCFTDGETYPAFIIAAAVAFNLLLTTACYWFIMNKITTKRNF